METSITSIREAAILSLAPRVKLLAGQVHRRAPKAELAELRSAGWVGAVKAVDRYKGGGAATLATFAHQAIFGAMTDYLRGIDPLSTMERRKVKAGFSKAPRELPLDEEDSPTARKLADRSAGRGFAEVEGALLVRQLMKRAALPRRERRCIEMYFFKELPHEEIAARLGLSCGRISQIVSAAVRRLREAGEERKQ